MYFTFDKFKIVHNVQNIISFRFSFLFQDARLFLFEQNFLEYAFQMKI